jgi:PAS domain S-box-containing protein
MKTSIVSFFARLPFFVWCLLLPALYIAGALIGRLCSSETFNFVTFWLPSGVYLSALLLTTPRRWPFVIIAAIAGNIGFDFINGKLATMSLGFVFGNTVEALLGAVLLRFSGVARPDFGKMRDLIRFFLTTVITPLSSAVIGISTLLLHGINIKIPLTLLTWWSGDFIGITIIVPLVLSLARTPISEIPFPTWKRRFIDISIPVLILGSTSYIMSFTKLMEETGLTFKFLFFLPFLWGAFRFRTAGMTVINFIGTILAAFAFNRTAIQHILTPTGNPELYIVSSQVFLCVLIIVTYIIGSVITEWRRASFEIGEKLRYERNFAQIASLMSSATPENFNEITHEGLKTIRTFLKADNVSILKVDENGELVFIAHESDLPGVFDGDSIIVRWIYDKIISGKVFAFNSVEEIPISAEHELAYVREKKIGSAIVVPVRVEGTVSRVFALSSSHPDHFTETMIRHAAIVGEIFVNTSIRIRAEKNLMEREEQFRQLAENVAEVFWLRDCATNSIIYINPAYEKIWGASVQSLYDDPSSFMRLVHPDDNERIRNAYTRMNEDHTPFNETYRLLMDDGSVKYIWARSEPIRDHTGKIIRFAGIAEDVTGDVLHEADLQSALIEKASLLKEIHHRVKNNMQVISSLFTLSVRYITDTAYLELAEAMKGRIHSMALIHEQLYQTDNLSKIDFRLYINSLIAKIRQTHGQQSQIIDVKIDIMPVSFTIEKAIPCALIVNELVSNAFKHAFKDRNRGIITVSLHTADGVHSLAVSDNGVGLPDDINGETSPSLGLRLVQALSKQIQGDIKIEPGPGSHFIIRFPE